MKLRTFLFWTHLTAGLVAGIVILIMSVTGTLLTFQQSVLKVIERSQRFVEVPAGAGRLEVGVLLARARQAVPDADLQPAGACGHLDETLRSLDHLEHRLLERQ